MSYEVEYTDLDSPATIKKALDDCRQWLGNARYKKVCKLLTDDQGRSSENIIRFGLMMQGIQGYPATAMIKTFCKQQ
jgi:hypothetical protein